MCYSGKCLGENFMGDCIITTDERNFLKSNFGFNCLAPQAPEEEDLPFEEAYKALWDYRNAREVARKLTGKWI